ncbi:hypothetical protein HC928_07535 [bacterium]|nr:hypothetical protein [bacterium]
MDLSRIETKLVDGKYLGDLVKIEETPLERYGFWTFLGVAILASLFTGTFVGFPAYAILSGILSSIKLWFPDVYNTISAPLIIFVSNPNTIIILFGGIRRSGVFLLELLVLDATL